MFRKYPCVLQSENSDCGAAALATVAQHYDLKFSLTTLRHLAGTDRAGTNFLGLVTAAERIGFSAKAVRGSIKALQGATLPVIAHIKSTEGLGHFVVVFEAGSRGVVIADPATGIRKLSWTEFEAIWPGYMLLIAPDETRIGTLDCPRSQSPLARLWGMLQFHRGVLVEAVMCAILMNLLGISISYFVQHLVDSVLVRGESRLLNAMGIGMIAILVFRTLFSVLRQYLLAHVGRQIDLALISGYARHVLTLPMNFFEMRQIGEIVSRVNDAGKVREAISGTALTVLVDGVVVIVTMCLLWTYDLQLAVVATLFVPLWVGVIWLHHPATVRISRDAMEESAKLSAHLIEDVAGIETIKAYGIERSRQDLGEHRLVRMVQTAFSMQKISLSLNALGGLMTGLAGVSILWFGGQRVIAGALTIGELMFFSTLLGYLLDPLQRLATINMQLQNALIAVDRLYQVMDLPAEKHDDRLAKLSTIKKSIEFRNVGFRYGCRGNVLRDLNLIIPAGSTVAIVGESGCGKSTLLKMFMRFYEPTEGHIRVDGTDLRDFELATLRERIGIVSQDPFIFNGTLRENIALGAGEVGAGDVGLNEIIAAANAAGLEGFISRLPDRLETMLGERGANLSGGERQRLAIARALLRNPALLIFDEATSHLDTATEQSIQENLRDVFADRTVLLVAHRLSTIRDAEIICVMHEGQIVEQGDHASLMALGGRYARLWRAQSSEQRVLNPSFPIHLGTQSCLAKSVPN